MSKVCRGRCAIYCRIAGATLLDQEDLEHQSWILHGFAEKEGFEVAAVVKALETGVHPIRPSIDELVKICEEEHIQYLVVTSLDRLCRLPRQCGYILQKLHSVGVLAVSTRKEGTIYLDGVFGEGSID